MTKNDLLEILELHSFALLDKNKPSLFPPSISRFMDCQEAVIAFLDGRESVEDWIDLTIANLKSRSKSLPFHGNDLLGHPTRTYIFTSRNHRQKLTGGVSKEVLDEITKIKSDDNFIPDWLMVIASRFDIFEPSVVHAAKDKLLSMANFRPSEEQVDLALA